MKIYKELYIRGTCETLTKFRNNIKNCVHGDWQLRDDGEYLSFHYSGSKVEQSMVSIYMGFYERDGELHVGNIIPTGEKSYITVEEYNEILDLFYKEVICLYNDKNINFEITSDSFEPLTILSQESLDKLTHFCNLANRTSGSSHPCDRERWYEFIFYSFDRKEIFSEDTLCKFLSDEGYWGKRSNLPIGSGAWSEEKAYELANEYALIIEALEEYSNYKGSN